MLFVISDTYQLRCVCVVFNCCIRFTHNRHSFIVTINYTVRSQYKCCPVNSTNKKAIHNENVSNISTSVFNSLPF